MAAELRLNVALDLQYFKRQLPKLSQAAAGFQLPIQVKFDARQVQRELNRITGRREFRININDTSIKSAIDNVKTLKRELEGLQAKSQTATATAAPIGTKQLSKPRSKGGVNLDELQALYQEAATQGLEGFKKGVKLSRGEIIPQIGALTRDVVKGLIEGLKKGQGQVGSASENLAQEVIDTMEQRVLEIRSPSKRLMRTGLQAAKGFEVGMSKGLKRAKGVILAQLQAMLIAMQAEVRGFGQQGGFAQIGAASRGAMGAPGRMLTSGSGRPRFRSPSVSGPLGVSSALTGPSLYGQGRLALPAAGQSTASLAQASKEAAAKVRAYGRSAARAAAVFAENDRVTGSGYPGLPSRSTLSAVPSRNGGAGGAGGLGRDRLRTLAPSFGSPLPALPGAGSVRELASEFGNATKQVLLFGTAYKALAFFMDFPSQVGSAVAALQSFRNTLNAVIPDAQRAAEANQFVLDIVDKYNVPLQTARNGFVKMYASMAPAGFRGEDIESLFLGVSQAAATFGLSADKVDRVQYAFAQMASKGQIMSEELKGQLGDVLPGAMGIFAKAAGLEGPDAIQKFSKALEDGAFKGENMVALLKNVGIVMQNDFGAGAEGAAKSFQGLINDMNTSFTKLYEAFEPLAVEFLRGFILPFTKGLQTAADGLTAFFNQTMASTREGQAFADQLEGLRSAFDGIKANVQSVLLLFRSFAQALAPVAQLLVNIAGSPVVGYLLRMYAIVLPLSMAYKTLAGVLVVLKARLASVKVAMTLLNAKFVTGAAMSARAALKVRALGLALKGAFGSTIVGAILLGLGFIIEKFMTMGDKAREAAEEVIRLKESIEAAASLGDMVPLIANLESKRTARQDAAKAFQEAQTKATAMEGYKVGGPQAAQELETARKNYFAAVEAEKEAEEKFERGIENNQAQKTGTSEVSLQPISLDGGDDGGGTDQSESAAILRIKQQIAEEERGILLNEKGRNELNLIRLNQELKFQKIAEMNANEATKAVLREEARIEAGKKYTKVFQELAEETIKEADENRKALEQQKDSRATLAGIILEAQYASKQISEEEYKTGKFLLEQEATRRRILGLEGLTPEERQRGIEAVDSMPPPTEQGKVSAWIEKTEKELEDFEGMATSAADSIASEFGTAFSGILQGTTSLSEGLGNAFKNIGSMFADMVMQMLAKWAMLQVMKGLFPGMAEGGVVSASGGGGLPSLVPGFANGGVVKGPTMAMVGEGRFNEAVVPLPNGKSIPVEMGGSAGGNISTNITVNVNNGQVSSKTSGSQGNDLARNLEGAVKQVIMREMQPGGMIRSGK